MFSLIFYYQHNIIICNRFEFQAEIGIYTDSFLMSTFHYFKNNRRPALMCSSKLSVECFIDDFV